MQLPTTLEKTLLPTGDITDFADAIVENCLQGDSFDSHAANCLQDGLLKRLAALDARVGSENMTLEQTHECYKIYLALGLIAASDSSEEDERGVSQKGRLDNGLIAIAQGKAVVAGETLAFSTRMQNLALCELSYTDQFLRSVENRKHVWNELKDRFCQQQWAPPIKDYIIGFCQVLNHGASRKKPEAGPTVIVVGSVKGGVGKSMSALALLSRLGSHSRTALIDMDFSMPTAQFHLNVQTIADALAVRPDEPAHAPKNDKRWVYPTCLDEMSDRSILDQEAAIERAWDSVIPLTKDGQKALVAMPDSISYCARIQREFEDDRAGSNNVIANYIRALGTMRQDAKGYEYVILDMSPGLYGPNGGLLTKLAKTFRTRLVLLSSPRLSDLLTSLYEGCFLAGPGAFNWHKPIHHFANMWDVGKGDRDGHQPYTEQLRTWINHSIDTHFKAISATGQDVTVTSGSQIYAWRMWSLLYQQSLKDARTFRTSSLDYDPKLRHILAPGKGDEDKYYVDLDNPAFKSWGQALAHELDLLSPNREETDATS